MKDFFDLKKKEHAPLPLAETQEKNKTYFIKRSLAWSVNRNKLSLSGSCHSREQC